MAVEYPVRSDSQQKIEDVKLDNLAAPDDTTDLDFSTSLHGLVPKGTNVGNYLKDDGTWSSVSPSLGVGCRVYLSTDFTAVSGSDRQIPFDTEFYDVGNDFASNTFDVPENGYYLVQLIVRFAETLSDGDECQAIIKAGSAVLVRSTLMVPGTYAPTVQASMVCYLTSSQYVSFYVRHDHGSDRDIDSGNEHTIASVTKLG